MFVFWYWAVDEGLSDTQARKRLSCWYGKNDKLAMSHGGGNIKQVLKLLVWCFCKNKGCKKLKYNNPLVLEAVRTNMAIRTFLSRVGDKKVRTVSSIGKVGAGVLPAQIFFVTFLELFGPCFSCWATGSGLHHSPLEACHGRSWEQEEVRDNVYNSYYSQERYIDYCGFDHKLDSFNVFRW